MRIRRISFFILLCCLCWNVFAAEYQIKGVVIDNSTRQPLEFVNVLVVGLGIGASTDANGNFLITQVPPGIYRLQASFLGYKTELTPEYRVNHVTPYVQIELEEENASLNESMPTEPEIVLADLLHIFHPDLLPDHEPVYYSRLK